VLAFALPSLSQPAPPRRVPSIRSIEVKRPKIVVRGSHLSSVEFWSIPTGTGITPHQYMRLGNATLGSSAGWNELWLFAIPSEPISATEIFARGLDARKRVVGQKSLPYTGASPIYDALWGSKR
jgi:hypothetical protein